MGKKYVILFTFLTFVFTNGMLTPKDESSMSLYFANSTPIKNADTNSWIIGFSHMTRIGLEIGFSKGSLEFDTCLGADDTTIDCGPFYNETKNFSITYHYKTKDINGAFSWMRVLNEDEPRYDNDIIMFNIYNNSAFHGGFGGETKYKLDEDSQLVSKWEFKNLAIGKIWTMGNGLYAGISYACSYEKIKKGFLGINLGYKF